MEEIFDELQVGEGCPFFGYYTSVKMGAMVPQRGNQCGYVAGYVPCQMEIKGIFPDWHKCPVRLDPENKFHDKCLEYETILSLQVIPRGRTTSIPFREWYEKTTGEDFDK